MKTVIYVDGFNLYHALKNTNYKWLNPVELARQVLPPECDVKKLRYFTARVKGNFDPGASKRQQVYINALKTLPEVEIHYGEFRVNIKRGPLLNLPVANRQINIQQPVTLPEGDHEVSGTLSLVLPVYENLRDHTGRRSGRKPSDLVSNGVFAEVQTMVEKGSDVNLAAHLLNDAWKGSFEVAAVISNDTDLVTPINMVSGMRGKQVFILCPYQEVAQRLRKAASTVRHIRNKHLRDAQFPDRLANGISKPPSW